MLAQFGGKKLFKIFIVAGLSSVLVLLTIFFKNIPKTSPNTLRILTYPSFFGNFGPGEALKKEFKRLYNFDIQWVPIEDSSSIAQRLELNKKGLELDLVLGLDQMTLQTVLHFSWKELNVEASFINLISKYETKYFIPFDWSPMGFILKKPILNESFKDFLNSKDSNKIALIFPKTSTVGLQFLYWLYSLFGAEGLEGALEALGQKRVQSFMSWSSAYGTFQKTDVDMVFSFQSSLLYHKKNEPDKDYYIANFKEGHPYQIEFAGIPASCKNCEPAQKFVKFLLQEKQQKILKEKNYMFSVIDESASCSAGFKPAQDFCSKAFVHTISPSDFKLIDYSKVKDFLKNKELYFKFWQNHIL